MNEKEMLQTILNGMQGMQQDIKEIKQDVAELKQNVSRLEQRVTALELHLENKTDHHIRILAENHISLMDKLSEAIPAANTSRVYEIKVDFLTDKVEKLEKEVTAIKNKIA